MTDLPPRQSPNCGEAAAALRLMLDRTAAVCTCGATTLCPDVAATGKHKQAS